MSDATALAADIASGRTTARSAMKAALTAAGQLGSLGAVARVNYARGMADAEAADKAPCEGRGPFHGVPILAKDLGSYARGLAPVAGSPAIRERTHDPEDDSELFQRFRAAGLVPFGLTTVPEFGLALSSEPPNAPPALNPFDFSKTPGGSSGGAAAAVAAGIVAIAHATDAVGSIRVPAACCELFGLKPTRGATPQGPDFNNHLLGLASELVLARSLRDIETAFACVTGNAKGPEPDPAQRVFPDRLRIAIAVSDRHGDAERKATEQVAAVLAESGADIIEIEAPDTLGRACHEIAATILSVSLTEWLDALGIPDKEISPIAAATAARGRALTSAALLAAARDVGRLSYQAATHFDTCDAILTPVLSGPPPDLGFFDPGDTDPTHRFELMENMAPNAALANVAGLPALAFPAGMNGNLPVGVQLIGPMGSDMALLKLTELATANLPPIQYPHPVAGLIS